MAPEVEAAVARAVAELLRQESATWRVDVEADRPEPGIVTIDGEVDVVALVRAILPGPRRRLGPPALHALNRDPDSR